MSKFKPIAELNDEAIKMMTEGELAEHEQVAIASAHEAEMAHASKMQKYHNMAHMLKARDSIDFMTFQR